MPHALVLPAAVANTPLQCSWACRKLQRLQGAGLGGMQDPFAPMNKAQGRCSVKDEVHTMYGVQAVCTMY